MTDKDLELVIGGVTPRQKYGVIGAGLGIAFGVFFGVVVLAVLLNTKKQPRMVTIEYGKL